MWEQKADKANFRVVKRELTEGQHMKKVKQSLALFLFFCLLLQPLAAVASEITPKVNAKEKMRGLWVASVLNLDYPTKQTTDSAALKNEAISILNKAESIGLNAVFLQVRPTGDALYPSEYFPWSKYLTGKQGLAPNNQFDPLKFWIEEAHKRGIELHAWINPYRLTKKTKNEKAHDYAALDSMNIANLRKDWVVEHTDGNLYLNPGIPEVRNFITNGVLEIIDNYDVDGIHFDDYFYPGRSFNDQETFKQYGKNYSNIEDWRRDNVTTLINELNAAIKKSNSKVKFGISPFGIWNNKKSNALGSDTAGAESYRDHYADTRKWVKNGIIDYITPQIYWNIDFKIADYAKLVAWWNDVVDGTNVKLYIGQAAYRTGNKTISSPWYGTSEIIRQLDFNKDYKNVSGSIFYNYSAFKNSVALQNAIKNYYIGNNNNNNWGTKDTVDRTGSLYPLNLARPTGNLKTSYQTYYLTGSSNPNKPLYLNGKEVKGRSEQGFFGVLVSLKLGKNNIILKQDNQEIKRVITRVKSSSSSLPKTATILGTYPQMEEYWQSGEKIKLYCKAPIGAKLTAKVNGEVFEMIPNTTKPQSKLAYTTFTYPYTIPAGQGQPKRYSLGKIEYTMVYQGQKKSIQSPAKLGVIMKDTPYYAEVKDDIVNTYLTGSTSGGSQYELYKGMTDKITATSKNYVRLGMGHWVKRGNVSIYQSPSDQTGYITDVSYSIEEKQEKLGLKLSKPSVVAVDYKDNTVKVIVSNVSYGKVPELASQAIMETAKGYIEGSNYVYELKLKNNSEISGYYTEKTADGVNVYIRKRVKAKEVNTLKGVRILIDPGHGGTDNGALGPLGAKYSEKHINLDASLKLEQKLKALGAEVYMTRKSDQSLSLTQRLDISRKIKPDLFISMHANSMADNVDISKINGFSIYYREQYSSTIAKSILNGITGELSRKNMGMHTRNFYVIRGTWTTSILFESGFVPNPQEFEWLMNSEKQDEYTNNIAKLILNYFN